MYKILLADDDQIMINKLTFMLSSYSEEFAVVATAYDGNQAKEYTMRYKPHIIILDIDLPRCNGVEVARYVSAAFPKTKILALSSFDDFCFVKPIMQLGAVDYLLKHELNQDILYSKLCSLHIEIDKELDDEKNFEFYSLAAKQHLLKEFISLDASDIPEELKSRYDIWFGDCSKLICMEVENFRFIEKNGINFYQEKTVNSIINICNGILGTIKNGVILYIEDGKFLIALNFRDYISEKAKQNLKDSVINSFKSNLKKLLNLNVLFTTSEHTSSRVNIRNHYLKLNSKKEEEKTINKEESSQFDGLSIVDELQLVEYLKAGDINLIENKINKLFAQSKVKGISASKLSYNLLTLTQRFFSGTSAIQNYDFSSEKRNFLNCTTDEDYKNQTLKLFENIAQSKKIVYSNSISSTTVKTAVDYIQKNYTKNITLSQVSAHCYVSEVYLSKIFKSTTGNNFVNYLNELRVKRAALELKNSETSIKEICEISGFRNYNYFIKVFRTIMGVTPLVYKQGVRNVK